MSLLGTEYKINIHLDPVNGVKMVDYDFEAKIFVYSNRFVLIKKEQMIKEDDENYVVIIEGENALKIGRGQVKVQVTAFIPDSDFSDGFRTEIIEFNNVKTII